MSFLQFSRKVFGSALDCLWEALSAFAVRGTSGSSAASFFQLLVVPSSDPFEDDWVTKEDGILREERDGRIKGGLSVLETDFGGHSRFSLISSLVESPVIWDTTLELRDGELAERDRRFVCVSNRPIRLATLCRGRSSGSGLGCR